MNHQPSWISFKAQTTASRLSFLLLSKLLASLLFIGSIFQVFTCASPSPKHSQGSLDGFDEIVNHNLHSHNHEPRRLRPSASRSNPVVSATSVLPSAVSGEVHRNELALDTSFVDSLVRPRSINDWSVADFVLVSTMDGSLHALDRQTGLEVWSIPGDVPLVQVSTADALRNSSKPLNDMPDDRDLIWMTEPIGEGTLFYFSPGKGLQQLPLSIKELVQSPYAFGKDQKLITGSHHTTLYSIEAHTGRVLKVYGAEKSGFSQTACPTNRNPFQADNEDLEDFDIFEDNKHFLDDKSSFMIGRTGKFI